MQGQRGFNRRRHNTQHANIEYKMKIDLPSFDGLMDEEEFLDWASKVEIILNMQTF